MLTHEGIKSQVMVRSARAELLATTLLDRPSPARAHTHTHCLILSPYVLSPLIAIISGGMLTEPNWHQRGDGGEHKGSADTD